MKKKTYVDRGEEGFVLPAVILTLMAVGALATAGFMLTRTDLEVGLNHRTSVEAGNLADRGLAKYLAEHERPGNDTTYVFFGDDTARISLSHLLAISSTGQDTMYRLVSEGRQVLPRGGIARQSRSTVVTWAGHANPIRAAAIAGKEMDLEGEKPELSGENACDGATLGDGAGGAVTPDGWKEHDDQKVYGSPPVDSSYATGAEVLEAAGFDSETWQEIQDGEGVNPDVVITDPKVWPDFDTIASDRWLVITFEDEDGAFEVEPDDDWEEPDWEDMGDDDEESEDDDEGGTYGPNDASYYGRGVIVTRGKFEVKKKGFWWDGLVLAGGETKMEKEGTVVEGSVIGGLDAVIGGDGKKVTIKKDGTRVQYHSCNVKSASQTRAVFQNFSEQSGTFSQQPGTWSGSF